MNGIGARRSRAPPAGSPARPCRGPGRRAPRRSRSRASRARRSRSRGRRRRALGLGQLAHLLRLEAAGEELARGRLDLALLVVEVEVHRRSLLAQLRQAEHPLGDDVLEHLGGAALDRVGPRAQEAVGPERVALRAPRRRRPRPRARSAPGSVDDHCSFAIEPSGPGDADLHRRGQRPHRAEPQALDPDLQPRDLVADDRVVGRGRARLASSTARRARSRARAPPRRRGRRARSSAS